MAMPSPASATSGIERHGALPGGRSGPSLERHDRPTGLQTQRSPSRRKGAQRQRLRVLRNLASSALGLSPSELPGRARRPRRAGEGRGDCFAAAQPEASPLIVALGSLTVW